MDEDIIIPMIAIGVILFMFLLVVMICPALPKCTFEEKVEVEAIITEVRYRGPIITQYVKRAADHDIYFEYEGIEGNWDTNHNTYELYKDKIGEPIKCYLITRTYDNGEMKRTLVAVDDYEERK